MPANKKTTKKGKTGETIDPVKTHIEQQRAIEERDALATELIEKGKKRRFLTYAEILKFSDIEDDVLFLDELYGRLGDAEVEVVEGATSSGGGGMLDMQMKNYLRKILLQKNNRDQGFNSNVSQRNW